MKYDLIFKIIEIILQLVLLIFAGMALHAWKREIRGRDKYKLAKNLLSYIKEIRFLIYSKSGSMHQIFLNDILVNRKYFYSNQLCLIEKEKVYFDESIWELLSHINVRADIFLPKKIRLLLETLYPSSGKKIGSDKNQYTYIQLKYIETNTEDKRTVSEKGVWQIFSTEELTIKEYFQKWERLIIELQKLV